MDSANSASVTTTAASSVLIKSSTAAAAAANNAVSSAQLERVVADVPGLSNEQRKKLLAVLAKHRNQFRTEMTHSGASKLEPMDIILNDERPIRAPVYVKSPKETAILHQETDTLQAAAVIRSSRSPFNAPVIIVPKKGGGLRFCVDFRRLNEATTKEVYPMPRIDQTLDKLADSKWFSSIDALSGYWQVALKESAKEKTAFSVPGKGHFEFNVVPMGVTNAPAHFQRAMDLALAGLSWEICLVYLDDIIIFSKTFEEHLQHIDRVLTRLNEVDVLLKLTKCRFCRTEIDFLGHVVNGDGARPDPAKVEVIAKAEKPTNVSEIRRIVNMVGHFRRFVSHFAEIVEPLNRLLVKNAKWEWGTEQDEAFEKLRTCLLSAPILAYPDFSQHFYVNCDASNTAIGAVLLQKQGGRDVVIAYGSRQLTKAEKNYSTIEQELLSVTYFVKHWKRYLFGSKFTVRSDHRPLNGIIGINSHKKELDSTRIAAMVMKLQMYVPDMVFEYIKGKQNAIADALSRLPAAHIVQRGEHQAPTWAAPAEAMPVAVQREETMTLQGAALRRAQRTDPELCALLDFIEEGRTPADRTYANKIAAMADHMHRDEDGVLYNLEYKGTTTMQLAVPEGQWRRQLLLEYHDGLMGGHTGQKKLVARLRERYWWPSMLKDAKQHCASCKVCQRRSEPKKTFGLLQPITPAAPFHTYFIDFAGPYTTTDNGNRYVCVIQEQFSKDPAFVAAKEATAEVAARALLDRVVYMKGAPHTVISDRGSTFTAELTRHFCKMLGTKQNFSVAHHPQSHGQVENCIKLMLKTLQAFVSEHKVDWDQYLGPAEAAIRFSRQDTTGVSPFRVLHGREARLPIDNLFTAHDDQPQDGRSPKEASKQLRDELEEMKTHVEKNIAEQQSKQKLYFDQRHKKVSAALDVGRLVWRHRTDSGMPGTSRKLQLAFTGPYKIIAAPTPLNRVIAHTNRPDDTHTVHVSQLKEYVSDAEEKEEEEERKEKDEDEAEVEEILQERTSATGEKEYRVRWAGFTKRYDSWVKAADMHADEIMHRWQQRKEEHRIAPLPTQGKKTKKNLKESVRKKRSISPPAPEIAGARTTAPEEAPQVRTRSHRQVVTPRRFRQPREDAGR